jgi:hypothetical protein
VRALTQSSPASHAAQLPFPACRLPPHAPLPDTADFQIGDGIVRGFGWGLGMRMANELVNACELLPPRVTAPSLRSPQPPSLSLAKLTAGCRAC